MSTLRLLSSPLPDTSLPTLIPLETQSPATSTVSWYSPNGTPLLLSAGHIGVVQINRVNVATSEKGEADVRKTFIWKSNIKCRQANQTFQNLAP